MNMDSDKAQRTHDVRQRTFAVARKFDPKTILRTGFLGPCVAFYGINPNKGVVFMSHIDGRVCGLESMVDELKHAADGDIQGFNLYLTTNYTFSLRLVVLALLALVASLLPGPDAYLFSGIFSVFFYLFFGSIIQIYIFSLYWFRTWKVLPKNPFQLFGRVEVSVDACSVIGPGEPRQDMLADSKARYKAHSGFCMRRLSDA